MSGGLLVRVHDSSLGRGEAHRKVTIKGCAASQPWCVQPTAPSSISLFLLSAPRSPTQPTTRDVAVRSRVIYRCERSTPPRIWLPTAELKRHAPHRNARLFPQRLPGLKNIPTTRWIPMPPTTRPARTHAPRLISDTPKGRIPSKGGRPVCHVANARWYAPWCP